MDLGGITFFPEIGWGLVALISDNFIFQYWTRDVYSSKKMDRGQGCIFSPKDRSRGGWIMGTFEEPKGGPLDIGEEYWEITILGGERYWVAGENFFGRKGRHFASLT